MRSLTDEEAAKHPPVVREAGGVFTEYWREGGRVRCREVGEPSRAGAPEMGALLAAAEAAFGRSLPRMRAELRGGRVPDLDALETTVRDGMLAPGRGATRPCSRSRELPAPSCPDCADMRQGRIGKTPRQARAGCRECERMPTPPAPMRRRAASSGTFRRPRSEVDAPALRREDRIRPSGSSRSGAEGGIGAGLKPHRHRERLEACVRYMATRTGCAATFAGPERLQADRRKPVQAVGLPLVEGGRQRPARRRMLHRQQPLGRLPRLEGLPSRSRLTQKFGTHPRRFERTGMHPVPRGRIWIAGSGRLSAAVASLTMPSPNPESGRTCRRRAHAEQQAPGLERMIG